MKNSFCLNSSKSAFQILHPHLVKQEVEEFWVLALSPQLKFLALEMLFRGTVDRCMVHPRDVFRFAYQNNASSLILAHNHPQPHKSPLEASPEDLELTSQLLKASVLLQVPILDHLILGRNRKDYLSMADLGLLDKLFS